MRRVAFALVILLPACRVSDLDLEGRECPCIEGWLCDTALNRCVRDPTFADARIDSRPGDPDAMVDAMVPPADARVDAMPGVTCIGAPGAVLVTDNFEDLIGWTTGAGTWATPAGEAEQTNQGSAEALVYPAGTTGFTNYRVKVLMHQLSGAGADAMEIAFRVTGNGDEQYRCGWEPNTSGSTGRLHLEWLRSNGQRNAIASIVADTGGRPPTDPVTMEVLAMGNNFTCCLIEVPAATINGSDSRYPSGSPGIGTYQMSAAFDDFRVYMP